MGSYKNCFLTFYALVFCVGRALAGDILINTFGGLNSNDDPAALQDYESQDLLNINLQRGMKSVYKRDGYAVFQTLPIGCSTCAVHGGYHFQQLSGNDVQIWGNDVELSASVLDAPFVKVATGTVSSTWQCTDSLGFAYCVDSNNDMPVKTDGTAVNTSYLPTFPLGSIITSSPTRLILAGVPGSPSTLNYSQSNVFTNFTVGPNPTDPFTVIINAPGSRLTQIGYYYGKTFWWKDQSFGYADCPNQYNCNVVTVSNTIGTLDNSAAFWNGTTFETTNLFSSGAQSYAGGLGGIFFRGQDSHFYVYDGYQLTRISRKVTPTVEAANKKKANSWGQPANTSFLSGSFVTSTATIAGGPVYLNYFSDNLTQSTLTGWTAFSPATWIENTQGMAPATTNTGGTIVQVHTNNLQTNATSYLEGVTFNLTGTIADTDLAGAIYSAVNGATYNGYFIVAQANAASGNYFVQCGTVSGNSFSTQLNVNTSVPLTAATHTLKITRTFGGIFNCYFDDVNEGNFTDTTYSGMNQPILACRASNYSTDNCNFVQFIVSAATGTYYSPINNAPNLTSWGILSEVYNPIGTSNFSIRASTNSFTVLSATPAWTSISPNSLVSIATGTFMQVKDDFSMLAPPTFSFANIPGGLTSFTLNWFEGNAADKAYMIYYKDAIWTSVSTGTVSTNNDIFYLDLLNSYQWLIYNIPANGFLNENNSLYFGDPIQGRILKFGGVTGDVGNSINSYWKSKDFTGQDPTVQNQFNKSSFVFGASGSTVTYTVLFDQNRSYSNSFSLVDQGGALDVKRGFNLPVSSLGTFYNFKIGDNSINQKWKMLMHTVNYSPLYWKPQTQ